MDFVDAHKGEHGVEPILTTLAATPVGIAPSTYYAAKKRPASRRAVSDAGLVPLIAKIHRDNYGVYGARKVWHQLVRDGHGDVVRCTVERLMRVNGLRGICKVKTPRTAVPIHQDLPQDRVNRSFTATAPNRLWLADITSGDRSAELRRHPGHCHGDGQPVRPGRAGDGFILVPHITPDGLAEFADTVVPILQEKGGSGRTTRAAHCGSIWD